jgi:SAM-dependent methyltransferase
MVLSRFVRQSVFVLCLSVIAAGLFVQIAASAEYQPTVGQPGKDVVWVPTCQVLVERMLDMAKVTAEDYVIDLGSGDGRTVITAAKRGARTMGVEYNPDMVALSKKNAAAEGVGDKAVFVHGDIFETDFTKATVLTMFLLPELNLNLRPQILDLKPGTRVVSNSFTMGEWTADETALVDSKGDCGDYYTAYLWIVPAKVEGTWKLPQGDLTLKQTFQTLSGTLKSGGKTSPVTNGRLSGDQITFSVQGANYFGRVTGSTMEGTFKSTGSTGKWSATQVPPAPAKKSKT